MLRKNLFWRFFQLASKFLAEFKSATKKITILGDGAVGKTCLIQKLLTDVYTENTLDINTIKRTPFIEIEILHIGDNKILFYDLAGQDSAAHPLKTLNDQVLKYTDLILLTFALDRYSSLAHLENWYNKLHDYYYKKTIPMPKILLIGTKCDMPRKIDDQLIGAVLQTTNGTEYIETSALLSIGINELKMKITTYLNITDDNADQISNNESTNQVISTNNI